MDKSKTPRHKVRSWYDPKWVGGVLALSIISRTPFLSRFAKPYNTIRNFFIAVCSSRVQVHGAAGA
jgi:hypothetical protein